MKIAIASGKGGTGKTLVSVNLAHYISEKYPIALIDLDVEEPNDFIFVKGHSDKIVDVFKTIPSWVQEDCNFCGKCSEICNFHAILNLGKSIVVFDELCHSCYACIELCPKNALPAKRKKSGEIKIIESENLCFFEGRLNVGEEQSAPFIRQVHDYIKKLETSFPLYIFDCPPGTSCPAIASVNDADLVILVTEPTPFGMNDLTLAVETMLFLKKQMGVVINRDGIGGPEVENYCRKMNIPIIAKIPYDKKIALLYSEGKLIYQKHKVFRKAMDNIVNVINKLP